MARTPLKHLTLNTCGSPSNSLAREKSSIELVNIIPDSTNIDSTTSSVSIETTNKYLRNISKDAAFNGSYVVVVNSHLKYVRLIPSERLETRLANEASRLASRYKLIKGGNKKVKFDNTVKNITVFLDELEQIQPNTPTTPTTPTAPHQSLLHVNGGTRIDNSCKRHQSRLLSKLGGNASKVLGFTETYGVLPKTMICETFDGRQCNVDLSGCETPKRPGFENMLSGEKVKVRKVLHICDSAFISDAAYHELAIHSPDLPRKSQIVACRQEINSQYNVKRTPGLLPGSYLSLKEELVNYMKQSHSSTDKDAKTLKLKISGDGAKVSKVSNFVVISFSIIDEGTSCHLDQQTLAIVNCNENYSNLQNSLRPLFEEINDLRQSGQILVGDTKYSLEFFVGGDMKFIQLLLGINSSIANFACPWCKVHKDSRGDISVPWDFYHRPESIRKINEMKRCAANSNYAYGLKNPPLLDIEPENYIPDELHMLMRIMDVLLRNVVFDSKSKDDYGKITGQSTDNVSLLVKAVQSCGVCFKTWQSKTGELDWTALSGNDMKKVLTNLPDKLLFCLHEDTSDLVKNLWKEFEGLYSMITCKETESFDPKTVFTAAHSFVNHFLEIGKRKREGYQPKNVTPYLHTLLYHVPFFVSKYGSLSKFSGQAVEKTNDIIKQIHQSKSNKLDSTTDALLARKRFELGHQANMTREKRKYEKRDHDFWTVRKSLLTNNKKARIAEEIKQADLEYQSPQGEPNNIAFENLSTDQLKELIFKRTGKKNKTSKKGKDVRIVKGF